MAVNAQLTAAFKQAALDIFDSMISEDGEYYEVKPDYDRVSGDEITPGEIHTVRMARVTSLRSEIFSRGLRPGQAGFIFLVDELPVHVAQSGSITYGGVKYNIEQIEQDPANVLWIVTTMRL